MPCSSVCGARGGSGGLGAVPVLVSLPCPPPRPHVPRAACDGSSRPGFPYACPPVRHSMRSVRPAGSVRLSFCFPRVPFACVCARAPAASAPFPPPGVGVARVPRVVPVQGAGRAVPCGPCPSASPASVLCVVWLALGGGAFHALSPRTLFRVVCALVGGSVRPGRSAPGRWGGGAPCRPPSGAWLGGSEGRGVALPRSVPLPLLGGHQSRSHRRP